ncbi:MAG: UDP-N-acetylmuramoyl-L-alanine--D-glutamate ligase, partial [Gemmatimonadaceae bacterium]
MNTAIFRGGPAGEVVVIGLARSGRAVAELLARDGHRVYASDSADSPAARRAAGELGALGVVAEVGGHDLARVGRGALVVVSPGVPPSAPPLVAAREAGLSPVGEIEIALHYLPRLRYVAVTGTNGKTTTTALVGHLLRALGNDAPDAGNIGTPLAALALREPQPAWAALELSSFQLHDTPSVRPTVSVLTNLSPDHLDRYAAVADYYADKALILANADDSSLIVVNADDAAVLEMVAGRPGTHWRFSARGAAAEARYDRPTGQLELLGRPLLPRADMPLLGDHNVANALAAVLSVMMADASHRTDPAREAIADALRTFAPLPHRMEPVGEVDGVLWINDSKATNV